MKGRLTAAQKRRYSALCEMLEEWASDEDFYVLNGFRPDWPESISLPSGETTLAELERRCAAATDEELSAAVYQVAPDPEGGPDFEGGVDPRYLDWLRRSGLAPVSELLDALTDGGPAFEALAYVTK